MTNEEIITSAHWGVMGASCFDGHSQEIFLGEKSNEYADFSQSLCMGNDVIAELLWAILRHLTWPYQTKMVYNQL